MMAGMKEALPGALLLRGAPLAGWFASPAPGATLPAQLQAAAVAGACCTCKYTLTLRHSQPTHAAFTDYWAMAAPASRCMAMQALPCVLLLVQ